MTTLFLACAGLGVAVLFLQFVLSLLGHHYEVGMDALHGDLHDDGNLFFGVLSIRAISSALGAFGIAGMAATTAGWSQVASLLTAAVAGAAVMTMVVLMLRGMRSLESSGTIDLAQAVDKIATVYIPVPGNYEGQGKVQVDVMRRTMELAAVTFGPALPTGARVRVVQLVDGNTAEVVSAGLGKGG